MAGRTTDDARALMDAAWRRRRESFDAPRTEQERASAEVMRDLSTAVSICREQDDQATLSRALGMLGHAYKDVGKDDEAHRRYEEAVAAARASRDPMRIAHTVRHLGDVQRGAGQLEAARRCYDEALALYRAQQNPPMLDYANALRPMAILEERTGDAGDARRLWTEARDLYAQLGIDEGVDECSEHLERLD
jgi:tetratricopeptide (TPR) repeat protein